MNTLKQALIHDCHSPNHSRKHRRKILGWAFAWALSFVGIFLGYRVEVLDQSWMLWTGALLSLLFGMGMIRSYLTYLHHADEMIRKIEIDAMATAFGAGLVGGVGYWILQRTGEVAYQDTFNICLMLMCFTYMVSVIWGYTRYQ